jgi:hypothetical protein
MFSRQDRRSVNQRGCTFQAIHDSPLIMKNLLRLGKYFSRKMRSGCSLYLDAHVIYHLVGRIEPQCKPHMESNKLLQNLPNLNASKSVLIEVVNANQHFTSEDTGETIK